jgi:hypothetical protein
VYARDKNGVITRQTYSTGGTAQHYWDYEYDGRGG